MIVLLKFHHLQIMLSQWAKGENKPETEGCLAPIKGTIGSVIIMDSHLRILLMLLSKVYSL